MNKLILPLILVMTSCQPLDAQLLTRDFHTPEFLDFYCPSPGILILEFDEAVTITSPIVSANQDSRVDYHSENNLIVLGFIPVEQKDEIFRFTISDTSGNSFELIVPVSYWPKEQAELLINEVMSKGSRTKPDFIELKVIKAGFLEGISIVLGSRNHFTLSCPLPAKKVKTGDYIILDFDKTLAGSIPQKEEFGWRFFPDEENGISGNNGVVSLYPHSLCPEPADCFIYSNRQDKSIENKNGWTSALYPALREIEKTGIWPYKGENLTPSDAVNSSLSTSTRSFNRNKSINCEKEAWYICESSGRSPGRENNP